MRYLGIDYGAKRIGIAVSNERGTIAFPHAVIANDEKALASLAELVSKQGISCVIVGDTRALSGAENPVTEAADEFVRLLSEKTSVPVERVFEAWSSIEASRFSGKPHDDASAAAIILQRYLDMRKVQ